MAGGAEKSSSRGTFVLVGLGAAYVIATVLLAIATNTPPVPAALDLGGTPFVPASDPRADGYFLPVTTNPPSPPPGGEQ